jgi:hypothetical protein
MHVLDSADEVLVSDVESADNLESSRHFVGVLRLLVEASGKYSGVLVAENDSASYRFAGASGLVAAVHEWLADAQRESQTPGLDSGRGNE